MQLSRPPTAALGPCPPTDTPHQSVGYSSQKPYLPQADGGAMGPIFASCTHAPATVAPSEKDAGLAALPTPQHLSPTSNCSCTLPTPAPRPPQSFLLPALSSPAGAHGPLARRLAAHTSSSSAPASQRAPNATPAPRRRDGGAGGVGSADSGQGAHQLAQKQRGAGAAGRLCGRRPLRLPGATREA